jgi:chromosome partitioning protein
VYICSTCGSEFELTKKFQAVETESGYRYFCSELCVEKGLHGKETAVCSVCGREFPLIYAFQQIIVDDQISSFCSMDCRENSADVQLVRKKDTVRIAIFSQKGGTGKTTTAINLAYGLAGKGKRTLLVDLDPQGSVATALGLKPDDSLFNIVVEKKSHESVILRLKDNIDILPASGELQDLELFLSRHDKPEKIILQVLRGIENMGYEYMIYDLSPSINLINKAALCYIDKVIIPVACDYLSFAGVKNLIALIQSVQDNIGHPVTIFGILPTFYDLKTKVSSEIISMLQRYFRDKVLPPIRINTRLKEIAKLHRSIFDFAPDSRGAEDYKELVDLVLQNG